MYLDLRNGRKLMGWAALLLAIVPSALCFEPRIISGPGFSEVTGRLTYSGKVLTDMTLCLDSPDGLHSAYASIRSDGSFRLINMMGNRLGAAPGQYHAHLYTHSNGPAIPVKYHDSKTSGLVINVTSGWNDFKIDLH